MVYSFLFGSGGTTSSQRRTGGDGFDFFILSASQLFRFLIVVCIWKMTESESVYATIPGDFSSVSVRKSLSARITSILYWLGQTPYRPPAGKGNESSGKQNGDAVASSLADWQ